jgi:hypothetical protein
MKAPSFLISAAEKAIIILAFLPVVTMVYPETAAAASYAAQRPKEKALVFSVNSKQTTNLQPIDTVVEVEEETPTLTNPCYPAPIESCENGINRLKPAKVEAEDTTPISASSNTAFKNYTKEEVEAMIVAYSAQYGIDPQTPKCIAFHESGYNQFSKNKRSTASGVFQYLNSTWKSTDEGKAGMSVFDADANVKAAVKYMAIHKNTKPWTVRGKCPALVFTK